MIDPIVLRSFYPKAQAGSSNRINMKITLTPETREAMENIVPVGQGKYGSAMIEFSLRMFAELLKENGDMEKLAMQLSVVTDTPFLVENLNRLNLLMKQKV